MFSDRPDDSFTSKQIMKHLIKNDFNRVNTYFDLDIIYFVALNMFVHLDTRLSN